MALLFNGGGATKAVLPFLRKSKVGQMVTILPREEPGGEDESAVLPFLRKSKVGQMVTTLPREESGEEDESDEAKEGRGGRRSRGGGRPRPPTGNC